MIEIQKTTELYPYQNYKKGTLIDVRKLSYHALVNTNLFREAALHFIKYGYYTKAPKGSLEYDEYWDEQEKRCFEGYSVGGLWIPGRYYFYLNFCRVLIVNEETKSRKETFMNFWELDYAWWLSKHIARKAGLHMVCLKARRAGFSYKEAGDSVYNFNFIPHSKSYIYAPLEDFLIGDAIMDKVVLMLDFLNEHTVWTKNRQLHNTMFHRKASYLVGSERKEKGYKSEIIANIIDDPNKTRGGGATKISFEEAGSFPRLLDAWMICMPQVSEGGITVGQMSAFGTGGEVGKSIIGLETLFYDPFLYDVLPFDNIWDDNLEGSECGFFVPCQKIFHLAIGENGIVDMEKATDFYETRRNTLAQGKNSAALDKYCAENPYNPREALMRIGSNLFPAIECQKHELFVLNNTEIQANILYGTLYENNKGVRFEPNKTRSDAFNQYPIKEGTMTDGAVSIFQTPIQANGIYYIVCDPYAYDEAPESPSIGAAYVYKDARAKLLDKTRQADCLVASYCARPKTTDEFIRNVFLLAKYYNAKIYFEIAGGGKLIIDYAKQHNLTHYLAFTPIHLTNKEIVNEKNRSYGIHITPDVKKIYLRRFADWLQAIVGLNEGGEILNLHHIYDIGLLRELSKYNPEKGNFDRVSACILIAILKQDIIDVEITETATKKDEFFQRALFGIEDETLTGYI